MVGVVGDDGKGLSGLEYGMNDKLSGQDGKAMYEVDTKGNKIPNANHTVEEPKPGLTAQLTLDGPAVVRGEADRAGGQAVQGHLRHGDHEMDVKSGEILAMANYPTFDPNKKLKSSDLNNPALERTYEPGSAEGGHDGRLADAGLIDLNTKLRVPGSIEVQRRTIKDHWDHGTLNLTIAGVIAKSSNVGTIMAAQQMRIPQFVKYLHDFGFGEPTGLNFRASKGLCSRVTRPELTRSNVAFGQGLSVNAVQMTAAVNAVANGGVYAAEAGPRLHRRERRGHAEPDRGPAPGGEQKAAKEVATMMEAVTAKNGTAPQAAIDGYLVAGKTGTAQQVDPKTGRHEVGDFFAGFAPADNPRFVTYVVPHDPTGARWWLPGRTGVPRRDELRAAEVRCPTDGAKQPNVPTTPVTQGQVGVRCPER